MAFKSLKICSSRGWEPFSLKEPIKSKILKGKSIKTRLNVDALQTRLHPPHTYTHLCGGAVCHCHYMFGAGAAGAGKRHRALSGLMKAAHAPHITVVCICF